MDLVMVKEELVKAGWSNTKVFNQDVVSSDKQVIRVLYIVTWYGGERFAAFSRKRKRENFVEKLRQRGIAYTLIR